MRSEGWKSLVDMASAPYRQAGRFAWHFARGKLSMDPVFEHMLSRGLLPRGAHVLDIGCGQGLLTSLLRAVDQLAARDSWPRDWAAPPVGAVVTGMDLMPKDIERARTALGPAAAFVCGDMRTTAFPSVDAVVILDVLHYVTLAEQDAVLARVRAALRPGGVLLLRVGDAQSRRGFVVSQWVDRVVTFVRGHRVTPQFGRPLTAWIDRLRSLGFVVESRPMSEGTPFANVLLVGKAGSAVATADDSLQATRSPLAEEAS